MPLPDPPADNQFRILLIEDNLPTSTAILQLLERAGFVCRHAVDPDFVGWLEANPHLLLVQAQSAEFDGLDLCRSLRSGATGAGNLIPIVVLGPADEALEVQAFKLGADDYLVEPLRPALLMARVVAHLRRAYRYTEATRPAAVAASGNAGRPHISYGEEFEDDDAPVPISPGHAECRLCGYAAPRSMFEKEDLMGRLRAVCPQCNSPEHIVFSLD